MTSEEKVMATIRGTAALEFADDFARGLAALERAASLSSDEIAALAREVRALNDRAEDTE